MMFGVSTTLLILLGGLAQTRVPASPEIPKPAKSQPVEASLARPELRGEVAKRVAALEKQVEDLRKAGLAGEDRTAQDAALAEAIRLAEQVLAIRLEHQGPDSPSGSQWTDAKGEPAEWYEIGDARRSIDALRLLASLTRGQRAELSHAEELDVEERQLYKEGKYADAAELRQAQIEIHRRVLGAKHPDVAAGISNLAYLLSAKGDYAAAEPLLREALAMRRASLGDAHPHVAMTMDTLAGLLQAKGDYAAAEPLFRESLEMFRSLLGDAHPFLATSINNLALLLHDKGDYAAAERLYREALAMNRKLLGDSHKEVATSLNNLAALLLMKGDYAAAEPLFREALAMSRKLLGNEHPDVANSLNNLATLLENQGDYAAAEPLHREALALYRKLFGDAHPSVATSLNNLAELLRSKGDYAAAEPLFRNALAMRRKFLGDAHPLVAMSVNNLALLLQDMGDYAAAEPLYREALALSRELLGDAHPDVARNLSSVASLLWAKGDYAAAEPLLREALAIQRSVHGNVHPDVAASLNGLAALLQRKGDSDAAEPLFRDALAMRRKLLGEAHPDVATSLNNSAALRCAKGDYVGAEPLLARAADVFESARTQASARGGLDRAGFGGAPPPLLAAVRARLDRPRDAWQSLERYFARALLDEIQRRESQPLAPQELKREQQFIGLLDKLDERIAALRVRQNDNPDTAALVDKLRNKREGLLAEFTKLEASFQDKYGAAAGQVYALEQIRARLTADAALLMWLDTEGISHAVDPNGEHWACIVKKTQDPIWVKLRGSGKNNAWSPDDDRLPSKSRALLRDRKSTQAARKAGLDALRRQRLAPLEKHLDGINHLIVLPAGWMNGVPIEALTDDYTISYAPSGSMFAWLREKKRPSAVGYQPSASRRRPSAVSGETPASENQPKKASPRHTLLALGDPVFAVPSDAQPEPTEVAPPPQGILLALVQPGSNADAHGLQRGDVLMEYGGRALKTPADLGPAIQSAASNRTAAQRASKKEIPIRVWREGKTLDLTLAPGRMGVRAAQGPAAEAVLAMRRMDEALVRSGGSSFKPLPATRREVQAVSALFGDATTTLLGSEASEQKLAELAASGELRQYRYLHLATHGVLDDKRAMNSALILAQDNLPDPYEQYMSDKPIFDGRLTAKQIVRTWKLDADLVTLSACQTALGKQAGGEGMIGFSQALFAAGARSLVLSLWKVDDTATMLLMRRFYENLLGRFDETRAVAGDDYAPGTPMPKATALREAKRWLRGMTLPERDRTLQAMHLEDRLASRGRPGTAVSPLGGAKESKPYDHPYYWAAFILVGDPG